jgi:hypothetical protein
MMSRGDPLARRLDADQTHPGNRDVGIKIPIAFEPPPTQAITASGWRPHCSCICAIDFTTDDRLEVAHHHRIGCGPATVPMM